MKQYGCVDISHRLAFALNRYAGQFQPTFWLLFNKLAMQYVVDVSRGKLPGEAAVISFHLAELVRQLETTEEDLMEAVANGASVAAEADKHGHEFGFVGLWTAVRWSATKSLPEEIRFYLSPACRLHIKTDAAPTELTIPENAEWCSRMLAADLAVVGNLTRDPVYNVVYRGVSLHACGSLSGLKDEVLNEWISRWKNKI